MHPSCDRNTKRPSPLCTYAFYYGYMYRTSYYILFVHIRTLSGIQPARRERRKAKKKPLKPSRLGIVVKIANEVSKIVYLYI